MGCVFLVHTSGYLSVLPADSQTAAAVTALAAVVRGFGPEMFIVLSGFLTCRTLSGDTAWLPFLGGRIRRLYPVYAATLWLYVVLSLLFPGHSKLQDDVGAALLTVLGNFLLLPALWWVRPLITVSWTLSVLFLLYATFPLVYRTACRLSESQRAAVWAAGSATMMVAGGGAVVWSGAAAFLAGAAAWEGRAAARWLRAGPAAILCAILAVLLLRNVPMESSVLHSLWRCAALAASGLLLAGLRGEVWPRASRALSAWPMSAASGISYPFYLLHGVTLRFFALVLIPAFPELTAVPAPLMVLAWLAAALAASWLMQQMVDRNRTQTGPGYQEQFSRALAAPRAFPRS